MLMAGLLDLGNSPSSFGQTLALLITFIGIGIVANGLIIYIVGQVMAEHKQNQARQRGYEE